MILKQVIRYENAPAIEVTWVDESDQVVKCQAYGNSQMDMLAADLGDDAPAYQAVMNEVAATYVPPPPPTQEELLAPYTSAMDELFNSTAQAKRYDSRVTCALRAGYPGPFHAEGLAFAQWMDACNALGYQLMAEVLGGQRPLPTVAEFLALLPAMEWPA